MSERKTETKKIIKEAFTKLLKEKGFNNITVSDITNEAKINRGTFYLHYTDKFDLLEKLENDSIEDLKELLFNKDTHDASNPKELFPYGVILDALNYAKDNFDFVSAISSENGDPTFNDKFKTEMIKLLKLRMKNTYKIKPSDFNISNDYIYEILTAVPIVIILMWIKKGCIESPKKIANLIMATRNYSPNDFLELI